METKRLRPFAIFFAILLVLLPVTLKYIPAYFSVTKAMIMASLIGFYIYEVKRQDPSVLMAMLAALLADIFMVMGAGMYGIAMIGYALCMVLYGNHFRYKIPKNALVWTTMLLPIILWITFFKLNSPHLIVNSILAIAWVILLGSTSIHRPVRLSLLGAVLLGLSIFGTAAVSLSILPAYTYYISILIYALAQFLIIYTIVDRYHRLSSR